METRRSCIFDKLYVTSRLCRSMTWLVTSAFCIVVCQPGFAQELTPQRRAIAGTAIAADGWLTEQMHKSFWSADSAKQNTAAMAEFRGAVELGIEVGQRFQRSSWSSIKLSLTARRVVKTPEYETNKAEMLRVSRLQGTREQGEAGARSADAMLEAAASGSP